MKNRLWKISRTALLGLLALLLAAELLLQLAASLMTPASRAQWIAQTGQRSQILAIGDSNTFGLYLTEQDAWPAQLQSLTEKTSKPANVVNAGFPGSNSFRARANLPGLLQEFSPDVVLIMIGFNDFWTPQEELENRAPTLLERSRLLRLYRIASRSWQQKSVQAGMPRNPMEIDLNQPDVQQLIVDGKRFHLGTIDGEKSKNHKSLPSNLIAMASMVEAAGAKPVLLTYPSNWGFYPGANRRIKEAAATANLPLIDLTPIFIARCPEGPASCPDLLFDDGHPRKPGYQLVAEKIAEQLQLLNLWSAS